MPQQTDLVYNIRDGNQACEIILSLIDNKRKKKLEEIFDKNLENASQAERLINKFWFVLGLLQRTPKRDKINLFLNALPKNKKNEVIAKINEFSMNFIKIYEAGTYSVRKSLSGRIGAAIDKEYSFLPLDLELFIATWFRRLGSHVHEREYNGHKSIHLLNQRGESPVDQSYDFSVTAERGWSADIDCKCVFTETGNDFPTHVSDRLHQLFLINLNNKSPIQNFYKCIFLISLEEKAPKIQSFSQELGEALHEATSRIAEGMHTVSTNGFRFQCLKAEKLWKLIEFESQKEIPLPIEDLVSTYVSQTNQELIENVYCPNYDSIGHYPILCYTQRRKKDHAPGLFFQKNTLDGLKKAARKQLGHSANPFLAISIPDLSKQSIEDAMYDGVGVKGCLSSTVTLAATLFGSERASHLAGVIFVGQIRLVETHILNAEGAFLSQAQRRLDVILNNAHNKHESNKAFFDGHARMISITPKKNPDLERYDLLPVIFC